MTSKLTRERIELIANFHRAMALPPSHAEIEELARMALAAMDGEPVVFTDERNLHHIAMGRETSLIWGKQNSETGDIPLYRHAQPTPERDQVRQEHAEWSQATFGDVGPVGPLKHLSKEALEAAEQPSDLSEWADMQFLLWDAQRRAGITDEQITQAMIEKLTVNKQRSWPEPKDGEPRLHIKAQPAPAFPDFDNVLESLDYEVRCNAWESEHVLKACQATYDACRAAMLPELQKSAGAEATCRSNKNVQVLHTKSPAQSDCCPAQNGDTPAQSQGWIPVSERMPKMGEHQCYVLAADFKNHYWPNIPNTQVGVYGDWFGDGNPAWDDGDGEDLHLKEVTHWMPLPAAPQEVKGE